MNAGCFSLLRILPFHYFFYSVVLISSVSFLEVAIIFVLSQGSNDLFCFLLF